MGVSKSLEIHFKSIFGVKLVLISTQYGILLASLLVIITVIIRGLIRMVCWERKL